MDVPKPSPNVLPPQKEFHVLCLAGGAWRGAVQYWVIHHLMKKHSIDLVAGVSVGSLNGVMTAMGKFDELLKFWSDVAHMNGYLRLRYGYLLCYILGIVYLYEKVTGKAWMGGVYSMDGMYDKLKAEARLDELQVPFAAGVVSLNTGEYYNLYSQDMDEDLELADACLASSCMAPFMTPPLLDLGETDELGQSVLSVGFDGGGQNIFPLPSEAIAAARESGARVIIHAVGCMPLERILPKDTTELTGLIDLALRGLEVLQDEVYRTDLMGDLRKAVGPEGEVHAWLPPEDPGGAFEDDADIITRRLDIGKKMVSAGPTIILQGL